MCERTNRQSRIVEHRFIAEYWTAPPPQEPTTKWTVTDQLGSPRVLVDSLGQVVARRDFMPFGEEIFPDGTHRKTAHKYAFGDDVRQKFTGYQKDEETQLDFAEARMYQNLHGRFTAVDPLLASGKSANPQTFNRYVYVVNNPLIFVDPDGLQVATAAGKVYINRAGTQVAIFDGKPREGFVRLDRSIETTTRIGKATHQMSVTPNGWTVGDRVDGARFTAPAASPPQGPPVKNAAIRALSTGVVNGVSDAGTGIGKGIVNSPVAAWNGATFGIFNGGPQAAFFRGSNPFAAPNILEYSNAREASYGSAGTTGFLAGLGAGVGVFAGASAPLSVVPQTERVASTYFIYSTRVLLRSADETGPYHNFPMSFDQQIINQGTRTVTQNYYNVSRQGVLNDSVMYEIPGNINGTNGLFQIGTRPSPTGNTELIWHRFFKPNR